MTLTDTPNIDRLAALVTRLERLGVTLGTDARVAVNPDGTPGNVATGELIESAWGNAVADRISDLWPLMYFKNVASRLDAPAGVPATITGGGAFVTYSTWSVPDNMFTTADTITFVAQRACVCAVSVALMFNAAGAGATNARLTAGPLQAEVINSTVMTPTAGEHAVNLFAVVPFSAGDGFQTFIKRTATSATNADLTFGYLHVVELRRPVP